MQYLLSVHNDENAPEMTQEEMEVAFKDVDVLNNEIKEANAWVFAGGLQPADSATTVRIQNGEILTTDGPFAETKEQLGGFWIIEAPDLDAALKWAEKGTIACKQPVEVRPFQPIPGE